MRTLMSFCLVVVMAGCGGTRRSDAEVARGQQAVVAALDSWKAKESADKLKSLADPVEFSEELRSTHALTAYTIDKVDSSDKDVIRYTITLKLKDKKGKALDREVVYSVALKSPIIVARDPYY
jgi:hypothetical protein